MTLLRETILPHLVNLQQDLQTRGTHYLGHVHQSVRLTDTMEAPPRRPTSLPIGLCGAAGFSCHSTAAALYVPIAYIKCAEPAASSVGAFSMWAPRAFAATAGFVGGGKETAHAAQAPISRFGAGLGSLAILASGAMLALAAGFIVGLSALVFFAVGALAVPFFVVARRHARPSESPPAAPGAAHSFVPPRAPSSPVV